MVWANRFRSTTEITEFLNHQAAQRIEMCHFGRNGTSGSKADELKINRFLRLSLSFYEEVNERR